MRALIKAVLSFFSGSSAKQEELKEKKERTALIRALTKGALTFFFQDPFFAKQFEPSHLTGCQVRRLELFGKKRILKKEGKGPFCEGPDQSGPFLLFFQLFLFSAAAFLWNTCGPCGLLWGLLDIAACSC